MKSATCEHYKILSWFHLYEYILGCRYIIRVHHRACPYAKCPQIWEKGPNLYRGVGPHHVMDAIKYKKDQFQKVCGSNIGVFHS